MASLLSPNSIAENGCMHAALFSCTRKSRCILLNSWANTRRRNARRAIHFCSAPKRWVTGNASADRDPTLWCLTKRSPTLPGIRPRVLGQVKEKHKFLRHTHKTEHVSYG